MAENKKSFVLYCDQKELFDQLTDSQRGILISTVFDYVNDLNPDETKLDPLIKMAFTQVRQALKRDLKKYEARAERSRENGSLGGRPKEPKKPSGLNGNPKKPRKPDSVNVNDNDTVNVTVNDSVNDIVIVNDINTKVYTKDVHACLKICLGYFPEHLHPKKEETWLDVIDKLNNIDKVPFQAICEIVKRTREDKFWGKNFLSLTKLRKTNKDGIKYIIVFNENLKNGKAKSTTSADIDAIIAREMGSGNN